MRPKNAIKFPNKSQALNYIQYIPIQYTCLLIGRAASLRSPRAHIKGRMWAAAVISLDGGDSEWALTAHIY